MKRLRPRLILAAVLVLAASLIPTSSSAVPYDWEVDYYYYVSGQVVGYRIYNSCFGHLDYFSGQYSGDMMLQKYIDCSAGTATCSWYSWDGSGWVLIHTGSCSAGGGLPRPPRPAI